MSNNQRIEGDFDPMEELARARDLNEVFDVVEEAAYIQRTTRPPPPSSEIPAAFNARDIALDEMIAGGRWHLLLTPPDIAFVRNNQAVVMIESWLAGTVNAARGPVIPFVLLKQLLHSGMIACHLRNDTLRASDGTQHVRIKCIVQRLSRVETPDLCIVLYTVMRKVHEKDPEDLREHARALENAYATHAPVERGQTFLTRVSEGEGSTIGKRHTGIRERERIVALMSAELLNPATVANFFFALENVRDIDEDYSVRL